MMPNDIPNLSAAILKKHDTHLSQKGAMLISELFIDALEAQNLSINQYITTKKME